jgi:FAD/FMN-containing dehydrogenase/Fe-S oxidoreductase
MPLPSLADDLRRAGVGDVRFDRAHRVLYSTDASIYQIEPLGVVIPRSVEEVIATIAVCAQQGAPVLPRGAATSLAGQTVGHAVVIDTTRHLNRIMEINAEEQWVRCQPGAVLDQVNAALRPHGLMLGPDPASGNRATVGGTVGNNGTGAHSILYGMMADSVLAVDAVLADGRMVRFDESFLARPPAGAARLAAELQRILATYGAAIQADFPRHWRRASGYNLDRANPAQLIAGSEGTLAFMAEITLRTVPRPARTALAIVHFDELAAAAEATPALLELQPSAVELLDKLLLDLCRQHAAYRQHLTFVQGDPACVLAVEFYVESEAEGRARLDGLRRHLAAHGQRGAVTSLLDPAGQANAWAVRKAGLTLLLGRRGDVKPAGFMEDVSVPVEHLPAYVRSVQRMMAEHGKEAAYYAHASAGCLHIRPLLNLKSAADIAVMDAMQAELLALIRPLGGVLSGEHGDGLKLTHLNRQLFGPEVTRAFAETKLAFDPANLFNPGKKVTEAVLAEVRELGELGELAEGHVTDPGLLRYGPAYQTVELRPFFDWSADGGLARAVEMCNGSGDCRKASGAMCPSFQATAEEEHSTRGRANLLRAALSGQLLIDPAQAATIDRAGLLAGSAWADVYAALDLCLSCKACKVECPSAVDMAKIKAEVLAQRYAVEGTPLAARLFGHIHTINRLAAPVAPLANAALRTRPARALLGKLVDLHPARSLPPIAHPTFTAWFASHLRHSSFIVHRSSFSVILFPDTFTTYNYPQIGIAAVQVLEAAGFQVQLAPRVCCGRPMLSQGLIEDARRQAARNVALLTPLAEQGLPILICEPSCAAAFHEEYHDLLPGDPRVARLAERVFLIDDWLAQQVAGGLALPVRPLPQPILFHGHCHQKATVGTAGSLAALRAAPGQQASLIDAGCCGMAGAFGYTADHYEVSMAVAADRLAPAIQAAPDALICADGASCRQQIEHVTGRRVYHVVEVLAQGLGE